MRAPDMGMSVLTSDENLPEPGALTPAAAAVQDVATASATPRRPRARALLRRPTFVISAVIVLWWILAAVLWKVVGLDPYSNTGKLLAAPSWSQPFGTDNLGRSVFARTLVGADRALLIGPLGAVMATILGGALGVIAGYFRGIVDTALMRVFDVLVVLPPIIFLIVLVTAFGSGTRALILCIGFVYAPGIARIIRAAVLAEMGKGYVASARLQRESRLRIMALELVPNVWPTMLVQITLSLASAILMTATLSFLGLGAQPPSADWGLQINANMIYLQQQWWTVLFPALAVASLVVSVQLIADNIKEVSRP
ncbi:ABC transporter permease [Nocardioides sp. CER19]|uniref:ABC transporter permease n=1 Tax=Nocardioides sp. CER19 TaxID=3038538 RepID=UPI00244D72E9|nr:ABC transporter permease [Nocardioides sp. CER19]MDH2416296.1 ABC transporter permease [Nocardioides sp. CER19]